MKNALKKIAVIGTMILATTGCRVTLDAARPGESLHLDVNPLTRFADTQSSN